MFARSCVLLVALCGVASADEPAGAALYQKQCARCHGKAGEGTKAFPHPLIGNRSLAQLAKYIAKNMPEDAPGTCVGPDAEKVAAFMFDAFYSPAAQARIKAPRLDIVRLTVGEYRQAVADAIGPVRFAKPSRPGAKEEQGLRAEYFQVDDKRKRTLTASRLEPEIRLDLNGPDADFQKLQSNDLAAQWQGSVVPPETGLYDFVVRTEHSTRLWVNDLKKPLVDAWVKSGTETEFRGTLYMLAGRPVPVKLEFARGNVGVRKDQKGKNPPVKTTIALEWKPPHRPLATIPRHCLRPDDAPTTFAVSVSLPPDDRSAGYERGSGVSKAWIQGVTDGAIEAAAFVVARLPDLTGAAGDAKDRRAKWQDWCVRFVERAFRRPLADDQKRIYVTRQFEAAKDDESAVQRVVLLTLQSPRFLYREPGAVHTKGDAYDAAARMSFALWDSPPDAALLQAAASGKLATRDDVAREAERLLADPRAKVKLRSFLWYWLKLEPVGELQKDAKAFPDFTPSVVADLQTSLDLFFDEALAGDDFRKLLVADHLHLNGRLAKLYGVDLPADAPFQKATPKAGERAGVVTHPFLLASYAYTATSSPIHRGVFLARNVLGYGLRPPMDAFTPLPTDKHPDLSTRERIALQTSPAACKSCHSVVNPLGFALESFDAIGRFRDRENGKPIDASGSYVTRAGETAKFVGAGELAKFLVASDEVHEAFVARLFHYLVKQPILAYGPTKLDELRRTFAESGYNVRRLTVEILRQTALPEPRSTTARD